MLSRYYASLPANHWEYTSLNPPELFIQQRIKMLTRRSCILDFGCSSGRLLEPWVNQHVTYGFEINAEAADLAKNRGLKMLDEQELWTSKPGLFDVIILVDVFEHLRKPSELLTKLWRLIAPGGQLIVSTGDGGHWACRLDQSQFWYFRNLEHLCMTSRKHMRHLAKTLMAARLQIRTASHYDVPLRQRFFMHTAHVLYWLLYPAPRPIKDIAGKIPGLKKIVAWENAPNLGCSRDHIISILYK